MLFFDLLEESDDEEFAERLSLRHIRDSSNPLDLPNARFIDNFRLTKGGFQEILMKMEELWPIRLSFRSDSVTPIIKLATALRFLASGSYQLSVGNDFNVGLSQSAVSKVLAEFLDFAEEELCPTYINFLMSENEKNSSKKHFFLKYGFPGVIGCIDGTHVAILNPSGRDEGYLYRNRKGFYSLNVMLICDNKKKIRCVDAIHPGGCHDSAIWNTSEANSMLRQETENGTDNTWLLGDKGYSLVPYLLTPFRGTEGDLVKTRYNNIHAKCRNIIERVNGELKGRFRCILGERQLHYTPEKAIKIINACCALHNICLKYKAPFSDMPNEIELRAGQIDIDVEEESLSRNAVLIRNQIARSLSIRASRR